MGVKRWFLALSAFVMLLTGMASAPALAHRDHHKKAVAEQQAIAPQAEAATSRPTVQAPVEMADEELFDRSRMSTMARLLDWIGRLHPIIVHFPLAFFPAALFTAIVGRRRPAFAAPVRFLVVAGGIIAPIAAVLGWLDAMNADPDPLLTVHRWLGTAIGVGGLGLGLWVWRREEEYRGAGMMVGLAIITAAIIVQGWFGGALVHGMDHMNW